MSDGPIGRPTTLRFRGGVLPRVGDFLKAPRGRTAYRITDMRWGAAPLGGHRGTFYVERWRPADVPPGSTVHTWHWGKREKAKR